MTDPAHEEREELPLEFVKAVAVALMLRQHEAGGPFGRLRYVAVLPPDSPLPSAELHEHTDE